MKYIILVSLFVAYSGQTLGNQDVVSKNTNNEVPGQHDINEHQLESINKDYIRRNEDPVSIQIYYESLCPASKAYIMYQLFPAWQMFGSRLNIQYKPFGKANWTASHHGEVVFNCQHGPAECFGNTIQACLLELVTDPNELNPLINCIMSAEFPPSSAETCLDQVGSLASIDEVYNCVVYRGMELLLDIGNETLGLEPPLTAVPWILFNGKYNADDYHESLNDLKSVLCRKYFMDAEQCAI